jgi:hypothetical protein
LPAQLTAVSQFAWQAIEKSNDPPRIFHDGGRLVCIDLSRDRGAKLVEITPDRLRYELAERANWVKERGSGENVDIIPCSPPLDCVRNMLVTPNPPVPYLHRLTGIPTYSFEGSLVDQPGYNPNSNIYYHPLPFAIQAIPSTPSAADMAHAKEIIGIVLQDFPFASESDRAHAIGLFLLPFVRDLIPGPTPLHLFEAPVPGSGKGLLADALLMPSVGQYIGVITEARNEEEWRKRLTACFRECYPVILLDNISRPVDSGTLAGALTALTWSDRVLEKNETVSLPVRSIWAMTANNPIISMDITRRIARIRLDPKVDQPWMRKDFQIANLRQWVIENRGDLIWAGLTLAQAWLAADRPTPSCKPLGSFEEWSVVIGGILEHAGIGGFLQNLAQFYESADLESAAWRRFIAAWWEQFGHQEVGTAALFPVAEGIEGLSLGRGTSDRAMKTALGKSLAKHRDQVIGDFRVVQSGTVNRAMQWRLDFVGAGDPPDEPLGEDRPTPHEQSKAYQDEIDCTSIF